MRILFWADGFWPRIGGTETQGLQFVEEMQKRGHQCLVLSQRDHPSLKEDEIHRGISIKRFDFNGIIKNKELKNLRPIKKYLDWIVEEFRPDVIYLNTLGNGSAFVFLLFRKMFYMPVVVTVHAPYYGDVLPSLVEQICLQIDSICCGSKWGLSVMEKLLPSVKNRLRLIYYGLSLPAIAPAPLPFSPPIILLLGRLSSEKGFEVGIEAFYYLKKEGSDARLLIAGSGDERPFLEHLVDQWGLREFVEFTGEVSRDDVSSVINRATFIVMPSHFEGFGLVALEAMQMERPVIASDVGGLPEIVSDSDRGLLVPPKNPMAFFRAMESFLQQPEKVIEMGVRARCWAVQTYLLEQNVNLYENLFEELCVCRRVFL